MTQKAADQRIDEIGKITDQNGRSKNEVECHDRSLRSIAAVRDRSGLSNLTWVQVTSIYRAQSRRAADPARSYRKNGFHAFESSLTRD